MSILPFFCCAFALILFFLLFIPLCVWLFQLSCLYSTEISFLSWCVFFSHSIIQVSRSHTHSHTHSLAHLKNCTHTPLLSPYIVDFNFSTDRQAFGMLMARYHTFMPREHENIHDRDEKRSKRVTESSQCLGLGIYPLSLSVPFIM